MFTKKILLAGAATAVISGGMAYTNSVQAHDPSMEPHYKVETFTKWDLNGDGIVDRTEFSTNSYAMADFNQDGYISDKEWSTYVEAWADPYEVTYDTYTTYDLDHDGRLVKTEYDVFVNKSGLYDAWDVDHTETIVVNEYEQGMTTYKTYGGGKVSTNSNAGVGLGDTVNVDVQSDADVNYGNN